MAAVDLDRRIELLIRSRLVGRAERSSPEEQALGLLPRQRVALKDTQRAFEAGFRVNQSTFGCGYDRLGASDLAGESAPILTSSQDFATALEMGDRFAGAVAGFENQCEFGSHAQLIVKISGFDSDRKAILCAFPGSYELTPNPVQAGAAASMVSLTHAVAGCIRALERFRKLFARRFPIAFHNRQDSRTARADTISCLQRCMAAYLPEMLAGFDQISCFSAREHHHLMQNLASGYRACGPRNRELPREPSLSLARLTEHKEVFAAYPCDRRSKHRVVDFIAYPTRQVAQFDGLGQSPATD